MSEYFTDPAIREIEDLIDKRLSAQAPKRPAVGDVLDDKTLEKIRQLSIINHKPYLTKKELAVYLDVSERSIAEWSARPMEQNPLPCGNAGGEPRYKRQAVDEWLERENQRRRLKLAS